MKATIEMSEDELGELLFEYLRARNCSYESHRVREDGGLQIVAHIELPTTVAPAAPVARFLTREAAPPAPPPSKGPEEPVLYAGDLKGPTDDPDPESRDTSNPPRRHFDKEPDDEMTQMLRQSLRDMEIEKASKNG